MGYVIENKLFPNLNLKARNHKPQETDSLAVNDTLGRQINGITADGLQRSSSDSKSVILGFQQVAIIESLKYIYKYIYIY